MEITTHPIIIDAPADPYPTFIDAPPNQQKINENTRKNTNLWRFGQPTVSWICLWGPSARRVSPLGLSFFFAFGPCIFRRALYLSTWPPYIFRRALRIYRRDPKFDKQCICMHICIYRYMGRVLHLGGLGEGFGIVWTHWAPGPLHLGLVDLGIGLFRPSGSGPSTFGPMGPGIGFLWTNFENWQPKSEAQHQNH